MTTTRRGLCPEKLDRRYCTNLAGHDGKCSYTQRNAYGQSGSSVISWWGANPRPPESIDDLGHNKLHAEIGRLRALLDDAGIDWRTNVTQPGW